MRMYSPPQTYQQWLSCFGHMEQHPHDMEMLAAMAQGRYMGQPAETFLARLSDTVSLMLTAHCRRFLRQLDEALADGEADTAVLLARRFRKKLEAYFFYRSLPFLAASYIQTLDNGFRLQLEAFWANFLLQLQKNCRESMSPQLEDAAYEMKRMKITT